MTLARTQLSLLTVLAGFVAAATMGVHFAWTAIRTPLPSEPSGLQAGAAGTPLDWPVLEVRDSPANILFTRPVFSPDRTAPSSAVAARVEPAPLVAESNDGPPPSYIVGGVVISNDLRKTLLRREPREAGRWMTEGQTTQEGWRISSVRPDGITLSRGDREIGFALHTRLRQN